jgi:hypothetical protein
MQCFAGSLLLNQKIQHLDSNLTHHDDPLFHHLNVDPFHENYVKDYCFHHSEYCAAVAVVVVAAVVAAAAVVAVAAVAAAAFESAVVEHGGKD